MPKPYFILKGLGFFYALQLSNLLTRFFQWLGQVSYKSKLLLFNYRILVRIMTNVIKANILKIIMIM